MLSIKNQLSNGKSKTDLIHLFVTFLKKHEKNVLIIVNDGVHTWRSEDGVSILQPFSCSHEKADSRIAIHASKSSVNVVIVAQDTGLLMLLIYSYSTSGISKE